MDELHQIIPLQLLTIHILLSRKFAMRHIDTKSLVISKCSKLQVTHVRNADAAVDSESRGDVLVKSREVLERFLIAQLGHAQDNT